MKRYVFSKLNDAKHHIEFDVSMEELGVTSAEAKATHEKIKNWVAENYEFSVTNLYIAQVKRKLRSALRIRKRQ